MDHTDNSNKKEVPEGTISLRSAVRWYMLGFALLGGAVGFFAGSSQTPVIGTLLPLLFGLIGGAGGLYLTRVDLRDPLTKSRLAVIGKCISSFIIVTLVCSIYGVSLRTGRSLWSFFSVDIFRPESHFKLPLSVQLDPNKAIGLAMLRARIRALGVSPEEERLILERAAKMEQTEEYAPPNAVESLLRLGRLATRAYSSMARAMLAKRDDINLPKSIPPSAQKLQAYFYAYKADYKEWADKIENGEKIPIAFVTHRIKGLHDDIENLLYGYNGARYWLSKHEDTRQSIDEFQWALLDEYRNLASPTRSIGGPITEEVDRFLSIFYRRSTETKDSSMPWKLPRPTHAK